MRACLLLSFVLNLALSVLTLVVGPDPMATHFGQGGEPNGWSPASHNALLMTGLNLMLFGMFYGSPTLLNRLPARWINLPHKEYWLDDERRGHTLVLLSRELFAMGTATFILMLIVGLLALQANLSDPVRLNEGPVWVTMGLYFAYTGYWCVKLFLSFRVPVTATPDPT